MKKLLSIIIFNLLLCGNIFAEIVDPFKINLTCQSSKVGIPVSVSINTILKNVSFQGSDPDSYYLENEQFHKIIYNQSGNRFLEKEAIKLQKRLQPFRRIQLRFRGRIEQSMSEHEIIVQALTIGDASMAESALRDHVAVQGDKFHQLVASFGKTSE